jgi:hypothetical protein
MRAFSFGAMSEPQQTMDSLIEHLHTTKENAAAIVRAAENRMSDLLGQTHTEAHDRIESLREQNSESLTTLQIQLRMSNAEKEREIMKDTEDRICAERAVGDRHLPVIVSLLYTKVITVI